ncbi:hypothetical protein [Segatella oris]|uniref:hypothetical protein n=1 Tax=Segatella oris TaxID=28135 RepID=UPI0036131BAB
MKQSFIRQGTCVVCTNMTCGKPQKVGGIRAERYVMNTKAKETHNIDAASKRVIAENDSDQNDEDLNKNFMDIIANQT